MKYAIKLWVDDGWMYVTETGTNGNPVVVTYDTREQAEAVNFGVWGNQGEVVEYQKDPFGNPTYKLTDEEIEELRIKKQTIKEELYDKVKMEMFKASSRLEDIDYYKVNRIEVIDETGRGYVKYLKGDEKVRYELQDDNRTLKIFVDDLKATHELDRVEYEGIEVQCKTHPDAPHGFDRNSSLSLGRYVCECENWEPDWEPENPVKEIVFWDDLKIEPEGVLIDPTVEGKDITKPAELKRLLESVIDRMDRIERGDDDLS